MFRPVTALQKLSISGPAQEAELPQPSPLRKRKTPPDGAGGISRPDRGLVQVVLSGLAKNRVNKDGKDSAYEQLLEKALRARLESCKLPEWPNREPRHRLDAKAAEVAERYQMDYIERPTHLDLARDPKIADFVDAIGTQDATLAVDGQPAKLHDVVIERDDDHTVLIVELLGEALKISENSMGCLGTMDIDGEPKVLYWVQAAQAHDDHGSGSILPVEWVRVELGLEPRDVPQETKARPAGKLPRLAPPEDKGPRAGLDSWELAKLADGVQVMVGERAVTWSPADRPAMSPSWAVRTSSYDSALAAMPGVLYDGPRDDQHVYLVDYRFPIRLCRP